MKQSTENSNVWTFWLELALAAVIPFRIWWSITPTNVLNSSALWKMLESVGICGAALLFFVGIPVGILGIKVAKRMHQLKIATIILSVLNLSAGIIEVGTLLLVFCAVVFGGASV